MLVASLNAAMSLEGARISGEGQPVGRFLVSGLGELATRITITIIIA